MKLYGLLGPVERPLVRLLRLRNHYPPLFVVGVPRAGTTVVFQHVLNTFEFAHFPNVAKEHPRACVSATLLARWRHAYPATYHNRYGRTPGPMAQSDGWDVFLRWFPAYDHSAGVLEHRLHELRTVVRLLERLFGAPFANKNNANSLRIEHLARLFPDAFFVYVHRDPVANAISLAEARRRHQVPLDEWWSAAPPYRFATPAHDQLEQAVRQVWGVDRAARAALRRTDAASRMDVRYEAFCRAPDELTSRVEARYAAAGVRLSRRDGAPAADLTPSSAPVDPQLERRIRRMLQELESERPSGEVVQP